MPSWHSSAFTCKGLPTVQALLQADVAAEGCWVQGRDGSKQHCSR